LITAKNVCDHFSFFDALHVGDNPIVAAVAVEYSAKITEEHVGLSPFPSSIDAS
jgi:hypothetical protein